MQAYAAKLGIKVDKDGACIIKNGASYTIRDAKTIQLDSGDIECGSKDIQVNDVKMVHGGTQYVVSETGANMSISVLSGAVTATNVNNKETADISAGNKITYNSSTLKFSSPEKIDVGSVEKFWEPTTHNVQKKTSSNLFFPMLAAVFFLVGIVVIFSVRKFTKKSR